MQATQPTMLSSLHTNEREIYSFITQSQHADHLDGLTATHIIN